MPMNPDTLKFAADASAQITTWALGVGGASLLAIVSTSYRRPAKVAHRLPYLLFVPGWLFLALSLFAGNRVNGGYLAARIAKDEHFQSASDVVNLAFLDQQNYLIYALLCFGIWLCIYIGLWVFTDLNPPKEKE